MILGYDFSFPTRYYKLCTRCRIVSKGGVPNIVYNRWTSLKGHCKTVDGGSCLKKRRVSGEEGATSTLHCRARADSKVKPRPTIATAKHAHSTVMSKHEQPLYMRRPVIKHAYKQLWSVKRK